MQSSFFVARKRFLYHWQEWSAILQKEKERGQDLYQGQNKIKQKYILR